MKRYIILFFSMMLSISSFGEITMNDMAPYRIPNYKTFDDCKCLVGKTITFVPIANKANGNLVYMFYREGGVRDFKILKIKHKRYADPKIFRTDWTIQDICSGKQREIVVYFGDSLRMSDKLANIYWTDEVKYYDLPFYFIDMDKWKEKQNLVGKEIQNPYTKTRYKVNDINIGIAVNKYIGENLTPYPNAFLAAKVQNLETNEIKEYDAELLQTICCLPGKKYIHPLVKGYYEVTDVKTKENGTGPITVVVNDSITGKSREYDYPLDSTLIFENDFERNWVTSLSRVEKPENPDIRYGKIKTVTDSLTRHSYEDNYITFTSLLSSEKISFTLTNNSQHVLKVIWDEASFVDTDGNSSKIMHNGIKYSERENTQTPNSIIRGANLSDVIIPINNVYYSEASGKWEKEKIFPSDSDMKEMKALKMNPYPSDDIHVLHVQLLLPIKIKEVTNDYIFVYDIKYDYLYPERLKMDKIQVLDNLSKGIGL